MSEWWTAEKTDFNEVLRASLNEALESGKGNEMFTLHVEEADTGIIIYPDDLLADSPEDVLEEIAYPVYKEDLAEDASLVVDLSVREVARDLLSKMLILVYINESREVEIRNSTIYEAELLARDLGDVKLMDACEEMLEKKSNVISRVLKGAIEQMMLGNSFEKSYYNYR